jgi:hypothetical protein
VESRRRRAGRLGGGPRDPGDQHLCGDLALQARADVDRGDGRRGVDCESCQGKDKVSRWVSIAELQDLVAGDGGS